MIWSTRSPTALVLVTITLLCLGSIGAAPLNEETHGEHLHQTKPKESGQIPHSLHDQGEATFAEDMKTPEGQIETVKSYQIRSAPISHPNVAHEPSYDDDLFKDMDAKTLAAILLQALKVDETKPENKGQEEPKRHSGSALSSLDYGSPEPSDEIKRNDDLAENVKSRTKVTKTERSHVSEDRMPESEDLDWTEKDEGRLTPENVEKLESMLQELEKYSAATKRERSNTAQRSLPKYNTKDEESKENDVLRDLDAFEELVGRKQKYSDYEESEEDAKDRMEYPNEYEGEDLGGQGAREANKKKIEEEKMADMASDLLLKYLLKEEDGEEEENNARGSSPKDEKKKGAVESEEEAENVSEEKRSDEDEDDGIDPQTIDRLIEISSKLHLPADDVIDIINDVEKKRKDSTERVESKHRAPSRDRFKSPPARPDLRENNYLPRHRAEKSRHRGNDQMTLQDLMGTDNALDYEGMPLSIPRRYRPKPNAYPNYIRPRISHQRQRPYYYQPPPSLFRNEDYYDDETQDNEEELENYIEKILLKHPEVFQ
ncbi:neurosecretory protein VGF-like [Heptranchias perlo]|uniref:neurosecretory protein VGF-like n=1 Tax=Heptranchias perlo TaxID=212740 RepID=UPI00355A697A